jgi:hypothetical protein
MPRDWAALPHGADTQDALLDALQVRELPSLVFMAPAPAAAGGAGGGWRVVEWSGAELLPTKPAVLLARLRAAVGAGAGGGSAAAGGAGRPARESEREGLLSGGDIAPTSAPGGEEAAAPPLEDPAAAAAREAAAVIERKALPDAGVWTALAKLDDGGIVDASGKRCGVDELRGYEAVALYFSASWCGP